MKLTRTKASEVAQKSQITIGTLYTSQSLQAAAVAFNKQSNEYHVNIKTYIDDNNWTETSWSDGITAKMCIRDSPYSQTGGIAVLKGNLAPDSGVVKRSAVAPEMLVHEGPARVFDCEEDAIDAIKSGKIVAGDVVVIRYEGPKMCIRDRHISFNDP